jgi:hypothetical protein
MKKSFFSSSKIRVKQSQLQPSQKADDDDDDDDAFIISSHHYDDNNTLGQRPHLRNAPSILWSAILRNDTVLVEANVGVVNLDVQHAAQLLLKKPPTPGWEHATLSNRHRTKQTTVNKSSYCCDDVGGRSFSITRDPSDKLKGMKFHVYEHFPEEDDDDDDGDYDNNKMDVGYGDEWVNKPSPARKVQRRYKNDGMTIWTYACVYDPMFVDFIQVQSFLEKIVTVTENFRQPVIRVEGEMKYEPWHEHQPLNKNTFSHSNDAISPAQRSPQDVWRYGSHHAAQSTFAPVLLQRMEEVSYLGKLAMCHAKIEAVKEIMSRNIDLILENDQRVAVMANEKAAQLNEMAKVFAKNSQKVKRQMLWNNAKHGALMGAAITAGVAVAVVPVVALL